MRKTAIFLFVIVSLIIFGASCGQKSTEPVQSFNEDAIYLKTGFYFGLCDGYCKADLEFSDDRVRLTTVGWDDDYPPLTAVSSITDDEKDALMQALDKDRFLPLDFMYGCPDCADGGAEWIRMIYSDTVKQVSFEFLEEPAALEPAMATIRPIMSRMLEFVFPEG